MQGLGQKLGVYLTVIVVILVLKTKENEGANILFLVPFAYSHRQGIEPLAHKLVDQGHSVTFYTASRAARPNPKFIEFCPGTLANFVENLSSDTVRWIFWFRMLSRYLNFSPSILVDLYYYPIMCSAMFDNPDAKQWIKGRHFDLVIVDSSLPECSYALAYKLGAPTISYSPSVFSKTEADSWGLSGETSWVPSLAVTNVFTKERTFYDRLFQETNSLFVKFMTDWFLIPSLDRMMREILDLPDMPSVKELKQRTSLMFLNLHFANDFPRSHPPFVVPIGGMHCDVWHQSNSTPKSKLPKNMEDFIDGAGDDGFIFVSFGSICTQMSFFPEDLLSIFFDSIRGRKTRFLWKWDVEPPKNIPDNVLTAKWFPQQRLLAHPKIKGFISHGGLMSYQQSACYGVPIIIIPVLFDQPYNGLNVQHTHQTGMHLEFSEITRESLTSAIDSILTDKTYSDNAKIVQQRFLDRPMSPVDLASYWTKYVLRHKNTTHLMPTLAMNQAWWKRKLLDVWLVILIFCILSFWLCTKRLRVVCNLILNKWSNRGPKGQKTKSKSKLKSKKR